MITLFLISMVLKLCIWLLLLPFKIVFLPFRWIFGIGKPKERRGPTYEDGILEGLIIGSLWD